MNGDEVTRSALSSSSFDDGISFFLATGNGNMTPAYLAAARCVAALMPGPARAALTLIRRTGAVHDFWTPPRGVSAKMSTEKLSFRGCGVHSKKLASSLHPQPTGAPSSGPDRDSINPARDAWSTLFIQTTIWWLRHIICASCTDLHPNSNFCMESVQHEKERRKFS